MRPEDNLDQVLAGIRDEAIDPAVAEAAASRVWARIAAAAQPHAVEHIRSCADFQALIPDYRAGALSEARALLVKDHLHECVACRRVFEGRVAPVTNIATARKRLLWLSYPSVRWAIAAAVLVGVGLSSWSVYQQMTPPGTNLVIQKVYGTLYRANGGVNTEVKPGQQVPAGTEVRSGKDSSAFVELGDGSLLEIGERSGFSVEQNRRDLTIRLGEGAIIVQAARRRRGHLYVATRDCRVAVTGTIFSVNSGVKGSRVAVVEGEVHVTHNGDEMVLHPGDETATGAAMTPVAVKDEISWSRNAEKYTALLREISALQKDFERVHMPQLRYSSRIFGLLPASTAIYASAPNLANMLAEAQQVFQGRLQESAVLREWWQSNMHGHEIEEVIDTVRAASEYLGDEIVLTAAQNPEGHLAAPVFIAEVKRSGFREFLESRFKDLRIVENPAAGTGRNNSMLVALPPGLVVISPSASTLAETVAALSGGAGGFSATPYGARIAEVYRDGAGLLFSADLSRATGSGLHAAEAAGAGLDNVSYLVVEQKESAGKTDMRASVTFQGGRTGIASWIARPAPIGALDFISPDAGFVSAAVVKSPAVIIDEVAKMQARLGGHFERGEREIRSATGIDLRNDLAAPLGGNFAIALDGPVFPVPSWKLVVEVYDPARLRYALQKLVEAANRESATGGAPIEFREESVSGRTYYTIVKPGLGPLAEFHFTFDNGYLVAAPSRALVEHALQYRSAGATLARSSAFTALLPRDGYANFSAVFYQNLGTSLAPYAGLFTSSTRNMTPQQRGAVEQLAAGFKPTLVALYGEEDRLTLASSGSLFNLGLSNLISGNLMGAMGGPFGSPRRAPGTRVR